MARRREYNEQAVRSGTLEAFLRKGFADTSLAELEKASGLDRRQLYDGIGDKKAMFILALKDFSEIAGQQFLKALESEDAGLADIRSVFQQFIDLSQTPHGKLGCLICNASREDVAHDKEVKPVIDDYFRRIENAYFNALKGALNRRETSLSSDALRSKSRFLLGIHVSICVLGRAGENADVLQDIASNAIENLG